MDGSYGCTGLQKGTEGCRIACMGVVQAHGGRRVRRLCRVAHAVKRFLKRAAFQGTANERDR